MAENSSEESKIKKSSMSTSNLRETDGKEKTSRQRPFKQKADSQSSVRSKRKKLDGTLREHFRSSKTSKSVKSSILEASDEESAKTQNSARRGKNEDSARKGGIGAEFYDLTEKREAKLVFPPGTPLDIRVNKGMTISGLPETMRGGGLDLGDWIKLINGKRVKDKTSYTAKLQKLWDERRGAIEITYQFQRVLRTQEIKDPLRCSSIDQEYELNPGYTYLFGILSLFPGSSLGLSIKAYYGKIYVSWVDNGFKCLAMRTFLVGDAILSVNGQAVSSVSEASEKIITELKTKKFVKCVIERAVSPAAIGRVKQALRANKQPEIDPRITDDVIEICKEEITRMKNQNEEPFSILRDEEESNRQETTQRLAFSEMSAETSIGMDPINPSLLSRAPPRADMETSLRKRRSRKSKKKM